MTWRFRVAGTTPRSKLGLAEVNAYIREIVAPEKALEVVIGPRPVG